MKKILIIIALISTLVAQDKYLIYFKDKGITKQEFEENPKLFKNASIQLSNKAIERRKKTLGENYITFSDLPLNDTYVSKIEERGIKIVHKLRWFNAVSAYLDNAQLKKISSLEFVDKIDKVRSLNTKRNFSKSFTSETVAKTTNDTLDYGGSLIQDKLHDIPVVLEAGYNGQGVIIGFLDSGFNWEDHPALDSLDVLYEHDYIQGDEETKNQPGDYPGQDSHGTAVFSIGAGFDNGELIGPAHGASFLLAKTDDIGTETRTDEDNFVAAVEDFEAMGVDIITASLGYSIFDTPEDSYTYADMDGNTTLVAKAYNKAFDLGIVTVNAAGNEGENFDWGYHIISPADAFNVIAVGNVDSTAKRNPSSSRGPTADGRIKPEVVAMGTYNYHALSGGGYSKSGVGTSFSAPLVAGMIGQLLSAYPDLTNRQVRNIVLHSGSNYKNPNNYIGYGLMSAKRALNYPNVLQDQDGKFKINKMFLGDSVSSSADIQFHYKINDGEWASEVLNRNEGNIFPSKFSSSVQENDEITFYYTYQNLAGSAVREPIDNNYYVILADSNVQHTTDVSEFPNELVKDFELRQNYPNPFNPVTTIEFESPTNEFARITVYNILGQKIRELYSGRVVKGLTRLSWNGTNDYGQKVSSGSYIYTVNIAGRNLSKKMIFLK